MSLCLQHTHCRNQFPSSVCRYDRSALLAGGQQLDCLRLHLRDLLYLLTQLLDRQALVQADWEDTSSVGDRQ